MVDPRTGQVKNKFRSITDSGSVERIEGALVIRVEEGLFFGNTGQLKDRLKRIEVYGDLKVHPGEEPKRVVVAVAGSTDVSGSGAEGGEGSDDGAVRAVIFDFGGVTNIDAR